MVKELAVSGTPVVDDENKVTNCDELNITPLENNDEINLTATRTLKATPENEERDKAYDYNVSYSQSIDEGSARTDTIENTRKGGIALRLFKWKSSSPLKGGVFNLLDSSGKTIGTFTSDAEGKITILYSFDHNELYTLTETAAPRGYVGLQKKLKFMVKDDETVELYYSDGTTPWGTNDEADTDWVKQKPGSNGMTAYIDVYNKPFNFKIVKMDSTDPDTKLSAAHFALYKQANTTISGYVKNKEPMVGFEDMVTVNGELEICGGNSGRTINPGNNGSVYFLTETKAPFNYNLPDSDIIFRISALGVPSLISDEYNGNLVEEDDYYIYTLSVPNVKKNDTIKLLTIEKKVEGAFGNKNKEFTFTFTTDDASASKEFIWAKNGDAQTETISSGDTFTMKHGDRIEIALSANIEVTIDEENEEYSTTYRLGTAEPQAGDTFTFTFTDSEKLVVTNTLNGLIATGISSSLRSAIMMVLFPMTAIGGILYYKKRRRDEANAA